MDLSAVPEEDDEEAIEEHADLIHHILSFVNPNITEGCYKIVKNFDPREGYTRHSAKISVKSGDVRSKLFKCCAKFKDLPKESYMKKVFLGNDDPH